MSTKGKMYREFINDSLPIIISKTLFSVQNIDERSDEFIFGIYSIYEMGEFISSSLKSLRNSMLKLIATISNKVFLIYILNKRLI
jgi:hypothetical protein